MLTALLLSLTASAAGLETPAKVERVQTGDHLVMGAASFQIAQGDGLLSLGAVYEHKLAAAAIGGQLTLITVGGESILGIGPRATWWGPGDNITPFAGGSVSLISAGGNTASSLAGHAGIAPWISETAAIPVQAQLDIYLINGDAEPLFTIQAGVLGVGRKRS